MGNVIVFSLHSNKKLAKEFAAKNHCEYGRVSRRHFADGEVLVKTIDSVENKDVIIIESTAEKAHERLFELLLLVDSMKRQHPNSIRLYIPYFGYSRQERVSWTNEPVSCEVVARILDTAKVDEILTFDLHHPDIEKFFKTKLTSLPTTKVFAKYYRDYFKKNGIKASDVVVVSPDHGSNSRADALVSELPGTSKVILTKYRPRPNLAEHLKVDQKQVKGKSCIIIDDIIDTGGTIISATDLLLDNGAKEVLVGASHAVLSKKTLSYVINSRIKDIAITNTIEKKVAPRFNVLDIIDLIEL